jgi:WD40 repeat protein
MAGFRQIAAWGIQAAQALEHAHNVGIVHRDIKPANLMIDGHGALWVTDFGLARTTADAGLTMTGDLLGTLRYMSPEQALARRAVIDHRTDVYSLGATLYELLTLRRAFDGKDRHELLRQITFEEPVAPRRLNGAIPAELETVVLKAVSKSAEERYATAQELANDLERWLAGKPIKARPVGPLERLWRWRRRNPVVSGLTAATALVTLLAAIGLSISTGVLWRQTRQIEREKGQTLEALTRAEDQRARSTEHARVVRAQLYAATIRLVRDTWETADPAQAAELLARCTPAAGEEDLRGFEWYYLQQLCRPQHEARRTLTGHVGDMYCVGFSADGKTLVSAGKDGTVRLWDLAEGHCRILCRQTQEVNWAALSPDGRTVATASDDGGVRLWDVAGGRERLRLVVEKVPANGTAFAPDGSLLAAGFEDGKVRVWELPTGRERPWPIAGNWKVDDLTFSPDGCTLAVCCRDLVLFDVSAGRRRCTLWHGDHSCATAVAFAHDGPLVATGGQDSQVRLLNAKTQGQLSASAGHVHPVRSVAFSPDDGLLASASDDGTVRLRELHTGRLRSVLAGHTGRVWCTAFAPDGRTLATAGRDGTIRLWDLSARHDRRRLGAERSWGGQITFSPDGGELAWPCEGARGNGVIRWSTATGEVLGWEAVDFHQFTAYCSSPDNRRIAAGDGRGWVTVWDGPKLHKRLSFHAARGGIAGFALSPDQTALFIHSPAEGVGLWDCRTGKRLKSLIPPGTSYQGLWISPDGSVLAAWRDSGGVEVWNVAAGLMPQCAVVLPAGPNTTSLLAFAPDGATVAIPSVQGGVQLWDIKTGRIRARSLASTGGIRSLAFSPDGRTLATGHVDGVVRLWQAATGQELLTLNEYVRNVEGLAFSPDGSTLATLGGTDAYGMEVCLWRTGDSEPRR